MHPRQLRVGDLVDDYCTRERRLSNHAIVALVGEEIRQVRCTTCDVEHEFKGGKAPASRKKKAAAGPPALAVAREAQPLQVSGETPPDTSASDAPGAEQPSLAASAAAVPDASPVAAVEHGEPPADAAPGEPPSPHAEISLHRRLIRATLPRIESDTPSRPIPEFTMHRPAVAGRGHRHGKPFRPGQGTGQPRPHGKGGFGQGRHGQDEVNGNTLGPPRGGHGPHRGGPGGPGGHGGHGGWLGQRHSRHGFGRGPKKR